MYISLATIITQKQKQNKINNIVGATVNIFLIRKSNYNGFIFKIPVLKIVSMLNQRFFFFLEPYLNQILHTV